MGNTKDVRMNNGTSRTKRLARATLYTVGAIGTNVVASAILPTHSRRLSLVLPAVFL
jgi:hypothetical protein